MLWINFLVIHQQIGNKIHCTQAALQPSMVNRPFLRIKMLINQTSLATNAKEVTYLLHALNIRNFFSEHRYKIVSKNNLYSNSLSNEHLKQSCPSIRRCQTCNGFHQINLHDPSKQFKRRIASFSTSNPNQPTQNITSHEKKIKTKAPAK